MTYKNFSGSVNFGEADKTYFGKIEGIDGLVTYEGQSPDELKSAFIEACEDYNQLKNAIEKELC